MLTVGEFNEAADRHTRPARGSVLGWGLVLVAAVLVLPPLSAHVALYAAVAALVTATLLTGLILDRRTRRDRRLVCPHCDKLLIRSWGRVVATKTCPRCRRVVLTDPEPPALPMLTRVEVEALAAEDRRSTLVVLLGLPAVTAVGAGVGFGAEHLKDSGVLSELQASCVMGVGALGFLALLLWSVVRTARTPWRLVKCPRCSGLTFPGFASRFAHCPTCGQPLIADTTDR